MEHRLRIVMLVKAIVKISSNDKRVTIEYFPWKGENISKGRDLCK